MSVVIVGGNECMAREYKELCSAYHYKARFYPKMSGGLKNMGSPDLLVLFTNTISHTMVRCALREINGNVTTVARSHTSSISALKNILETHAGKERKVCPKN